MKNVRQKKTIKGKITGLVIIYLIGAILICLFASSWLLEKSMEDDESNYVKMEADSNSKVIDQWINNQGNIVRQVAVSVEHTGIRDEKVISAFLKDAIRENQYALMYYIIFGDTDKAYDIDGNVMNVVPSERSWYKEAVAAQDLVYTEPYKDAASDNIVVSICMPFKIDGVQCVVLADITISTLSDMVNGADDDKAVQGFLLTGDDNVIVHSNTEFMPKEESVTNLSEVLGQKIEGTGEIEDYDGVTKFYSVSEIETTGWKFGIVKDRSKISRTMLGNAVNFNIITVVIVVLAFIFISRSVKKSLVPIEEMKDFVINQVVGRENVPDTKNEVSQIKVLIELLKTHFIDTIKKTKEISGNINERMNIAGEKIVNIGTSIEEMRQVIKDTDESMGEQSESIKGIDTTCNEVATAVGDLAQQAQNIALRASEIIERVEIAVPHILSDKNITVEMASESKKKLENAIAQAEVIHEISEVSNAIKGIADETSLLALNASIEAARAGESGRGFAVVAEQIKQLSDNTNSEIEKIEQLILKIVDSVNILSSESRQIIEFINKKVLADYEQFEELANTYRNDASYYQEVSSSLGASSEELSANVSGIVDILANIVDSQNQLAKDMEIVTEHLNETNEAGNQVSEETSKVVDDIKDLSETVNTFNV